MAEPERPVVGAYPLAVRHRVRDLDSAVTFLQDTLGIAVLERQEGVARLDNGSLGLWLIEDARAPDLPTLSLALATSDVPSAVRELVAREGIELVREPVWTSPDRLEAQLRVGDWLSLWVSKRYNEDELGVIPELETELDWEDSARGLLKSLLVKVPVQFRQNAREKSVARGEALAMGRGSVVVDKRDAICAIVHVTPGFQHALLRDTLLAEGEDISCVADRFAHLEGDGR